MRIASFCLPPIPLKVPATMHLFVVFLLYPLYGGSYNNTGSILYLFILCSCSTKGVGWLWDSLTRTSPRMSGRKWTFPIPRWSSVRSRATTLDPTAWLSANRAWFILAGLTGKEKLLKIVCTPRQHAIQYMYM